MTYPRLTRNMIRGKPLEAACRKATVCRNIEGSDDRRCFCYGLAYPVTGKPVYMCSVCAAFVNNAMQGSEDND